MSGFRMLTDSRNILLLSLSAVSAEWKPLAVRAAVRASKKNWNTASPRSYGTTQSLTLKTEVR
jgi:hypothetical protein